MICGYANIYDLCSNKYTYEYASFSVNNGYAIPNTGYDGSVYRTDKNSQQKVLLEPSSTLTISTCDLSDDNPDLTAWECYLWYKNTNGLISEPPLSKYKEEQIKNVTTQYNNVLSNGILITINNFAIDIGISQNGAYSNTIISQTTNYTILLPALDDDIINFSNILSLATLMNANDSTDPLPPLVDYYNNAHFLNYYNLTNILSNYFNKLKNYKLILDNLIIAINSSSSIDDVQKQVFYTTLPTITYNKASNLSAKNDTIVKFTTLTCEEINKLCDPPCDPNSCQECVDGSCIDLCDEGECCNDGICGACGCWVCGEDGVCEDINLPFISLSPPYTVYSECEGNIPNFGTTPPLGNLYTSYYSCCIECMAWQGPGYCTP